MSQDFSLLSSASLELSDEFEDNEDDTNGDLKKSIHKKISKEELIEKKPKIKRIRSTSKANQIEDFHNLSKRVSRSNSMDENQMSRQASTQFENEQQSSQLQEEAALMQSLKLSARSVIESIRDYSHSTLKAPRGLEVNLEQTIDVSGVEEKKSEACDILENNFYLFATKKKSCLAANECRQNDVKCFPTQFCRSLRRSKWANDSA